jgi:GTPase SAR1 family protein
MQEEGKNPLYDNMRKLISVIDELKDVGVQQYIQLPRIAVVGTQSAGKSSLLESIVGVDFLPRGEGVVTRRPLELRLVHVSPNGDEEFKPYAEFPAEGKQKYYDFDKVREKIISLTDQIAGKNKGIVDDPITMTVYSTSCPDLTLVDLPGITRIALANSDQVKDIEKVTKDMCRRYARDPRTIILCVIPANQDMTTSDALKMAQEEDPQGLRTIGVITKIDIMDKGTNARRMLLGQDVPLKLGYVGVKGRSQLDINTSMRVANALKIEKDYFANDPVYSTLPPGIVGTEALTQKLSKVLFGHIRSTLPEISKEIQNKIRECEERLRDLGDPLPSTGKEKMQLLWNMITDYTENFKNNIRGKYDPKRNTKVSGELSGGAKIKLMYQDLFSEFLDKRATEHMSDDHINKAIVLHQGDSIPGFPSVDSFLFLITPLLKRMRDPSLELLNNVHLYLEGISSQLIDKIFARFPTIIDDINDIVNKALKEEKEITKELIENVIESERTYIFTNDLEYMTQRTSFIPQPTNPQPVSNDPRNPQSQQQAPPIDPEKLFIDEMRTRIDAYFAIVLRNIRDTIPKLIGNFLVKSIQEKLQYTLYNEINKNETIMDLVGEPPHIVAERETLNKVLGVLRKARLVLTKDPDLAPTFKDTAPLPVKQVAPKTVSDSRPTTTSTQSSEPSFRPNPNQGQPQNTNAYQPGPSQPKNDMYGGAPMNKPTQPMGGPSGQQQPGLFGGKPADPKPASTDLFGRPGGQPPSNQPSGGSGTNNPFAPKKGLFG